MRTDWLEHSAAPNISKDENGQNHPCATSSNCRVAAQSLDDQPSDGESAFPRTKKTVWWLGGSTRPRIRNTERRRHSPHKAYPSPHRNPRPGARASSPIMWSRCWVFWSTTARLSLPSAATNRRCGARSTACDRSGRVHRQAGFSRRVVAAAFRRFHPPHLWRGRSLQMSPARRC